MKPPAMTSMGSSPGARCPAGNSPGTVRRIQGFAPSTQPQSKWYLQVEPVQHYGRSAMPHLSSRPGHGVRPDKAVPSVLPSLA